MKDIIKQLAKEAIKFEFKTLIKIDIERRTGATLENKDTYNKEYKRVLAKYWEEARFYKFSNKVFALWSGTDEEKLEQYGENLKSIYTNLIKW